MKVAQIFKNGGYKTQQTPADATVSPYRYLLGGEGGGGLDGPLLRQKKEVLFLGKLLPDEIAKKGLTFPHLLSKFQEIWELFPIFIREFCKIFTPEFIYLILGLYVNSFLLVQILSNCLI